MIQKKSMSTLNVPSTTRMLYPRGGISVFAAEIPMYSLALISGLENENLTMAMEFSGLKTSLINLTQVFAVAERFNKSDILLRVER